MKTVNRLYPGMLWAVSLCVFFSCDDGGGQGETGSDTYAEIRHACVDKINGYRETIGLAAYSRWTDGEACADSQAAADAKADAAHSAFGNCHESAQNECPAWGSLNQILSGCLQMMWDEGPGSDFELHGHYLNMASTNYTSVACGFYTAPDGSIWSVQNFK